MLIANPIYDVVFKKLMEDDKVSKFFVGTLTSDRIVSLELLPQEYAYENEMAKLSPFRSYVVQTPRVTERHATRLDRLLGVFEQRHFVGGSETRKEYGREIDDEGIERMTGILHRSAVDPASLEEIEKEEEAWRTIDALFETRGEEHRKALEAKDRALEAKDRALEEKDKELAELRRLLEEKNGE